MSEPTQQPQWVPLEQVQSLIDSGIQTALAAQAEQHAQQMAQAQAAQQTSEGTLSAAQVQAIVNEALAQQAEAHNKTLQALAASMRGSVASLVPEHSGGPGTEISETWSQWEQEQARANANKAAAGA